MEIDTDYYQEELNYVNDKFNLKEILEFQKKHRTELIIGSDHQYECYINRECYSISLSPLYTLITGIENYKKHNKDGIRK